MLTEKNTPKSNLLHPTQPLRGVLGGKNRDVVSPSSARVACVFGNSEILILEMEKTIPSLAVTKCQMIPRPDTPEKTSAALKTCFESGGYRTQKVRISVKGQGVLIRFLQFPKMKPEELKSALSFELEQYIPFKAHEVVFDFQILEESPVANGASILNVLLAVAKREELYGLIQIFQNAGLQIEWVDADALATINALEFFHPAEFQSTLAILDLGSEVSTLSVVSGGKPRFIRDISLGCSDMVKRLTRKMGLSQEAAKAQLEGVDPRTPEAAAVLLDGMRDLTGDIKVSFNYFFDQVPGMDPIKMLFLNSSGGYQSPDVTALSEMLGFTVQPVVLSDKVTFPKEIDNLWIQKNQGHLLVPFGLCLRES